MCKKNKEKGTGLEGTDQVKVSRKGLGKSRTDM